MNLAWDHCRFLYIDCFSSPYFDISVNFILALKGVSPCQICIDAFLKMCYVYFDEIFRPVTNCVHNSNSHQGFIQALFPRAVFY